MGLDVIVQLCFATEVLYRGQQDLLDKVKSLRKSWGQDIRNSRERNGKAITGEQKTRRNKV